MFRAPRKILDTTEDISKTFSVDSERAFLLVTNHAGGVWNLEVQNPDGAWAAIGGGNGVSFDANGLIHFYGVAGLSYRLNSGTRGAKAWLCYGTPIPGLA